MEELGKAIRQKYLQSFTIAVLWNVEENLIDTPTCLPNLEQLFQSLG